MAETALLVCLQVWKKTISLSSLYRTHLIILLYNYIDIIKCLYFNFCFSPFASWPLGNAVPTSLSFTL